MDALPDFVKLAEAYGHVGMLVDKPGDVEGALREAIRLKDRTVFLDIRTDPTENVWPMVKAGQGITEMLLGPRICDGRRRRAVDTASDPPRRQEPTWAGSRPPFTDIHPVPPRRAGYPPARPKRACEAS